ncbi:hypothetical protein SEA_LIGMA_55 [Gordonia phage Ligma]|nr:hypothetical protein SEA_LIGMA_55 [Gordonia phage Ligma]UQT02154.1 hypothetical protein SEA_AXUMITE_55 [Gordonia phage Axumite]
MSLTFPTEHPVLELTSAVAQTTSRYGPDSILTPRAIRKTHAAYFEVIADSNQVDDLRETSYRKSPRNLRPQRVSVHWHDGAVNEVVIYGRGVLKSGEAGQIELSAHFIPAKRISEWSNERPLAEAPEAVLDALNAYIGSGYAELSLIP